MMEKKQQHWAKKREEKTPVVKVRNFFRLAIIYNVLLLLFLAVVVYSFIFSDFLEINSVTVNTNGNLSKDEINQAVTNKIEGKYSKLISKRNFIFFNSQKMEEGLKNNFKKIKKIEIQKKFPNKITISIAERNLILAFCSRGNCYFIDESGYAYEKVSIDSSELEQSGIIKLMDESGKEIKERDYVLLPKYVEFITSISDEIKNNTSIEILDEYRTQSSISEEVIVQTKKGWDIYLNAKFPIDKSVQTLKVLLSRQIMLRDLNDLEYIDLRSENKVFYRMIGGVTQEEEEMKKESEAVENQESAQVIKDEEKKKEDD